MSQKKSKPKSKPPGQVAKIAPESKRAQKQGPAGKALVPPAWDGFLGWLCLAGIIALSFLISFHTLIDTDIFWHLKTGQIIFETHRVPDQDIYSFTIAGKEWIDPQWIFQLIIYLLYQKAGYAGMILFGSLLTGLTWILILVPGFNPRKYFGVILFGIIALLTVSIRLKLRPEILTFFYAALEILLIDRIRRGKKIAVALMPALLLLWVNSEGLWPIYFVILSAFLLEELLLIPDWWLRRNSPRADRGKSAFGLGLALAISIPLTLVNPSGFRGAIFPWILFREIAHPGSFLGKVIYEFRNPFSHLPGFDLSIYIILMVVSALFFAVLFYRRRVYPASLALWLCFLFLSITALRNVALFAIITVALASRILAENQDQSFLPFPGLKMRLRRFLPMLGLAVLAGMIWLTADVISGRFYVRNGTNAQFGIGALETEYPIRAARSLRLMCDRAGQKAGLKIFSDASSSYLIWAGYPDWKVYIDPRLELYGEDFFKTYVQALENRPDFQKEDRKWNFDAVLLSHFPEIQNLFLDLNQDPGWALVYLDGQAAVFLKKKPESASAIQNFQIDFQRGFSSPAPAGVGPALLARERFTLGKLLLMLEQFEYARQEFEQGVRLAPEDVDLNYYLGATLNLLGRSREALPYLEKAAAKRPDFAMNQIQLARALASSGNTERAIRIFQGILNRFPNQIYVCMDLAKVYEMTGEKQLALSQWQRCREISQLDQSGFKPPMEVISGALKRLGSSK